IAVMRRDGRDTQVLTSDHELDETPAWSPDGKRIAYALVPGVGTEAISGSVMVMDADGGDPVQLTRPGRGVIDTAPSWSPDGRLIAFMRVTLGDDLSSSADIYVVEPSGAGERLLIEDAAEPVWSPDGTRLAFTSYREGTGETCFEECQP